jgi:hypothetical protein
VLFRSGVCVSVKNGLFALACSLRCLMNASRLALYCCPRLALHGLHEGTMLSRSALPSGFLSHSIRWSASVAMPPHQWHAGLPARSWALAALYAGSDVRLGMSGWLLVCAYPTQLARPYIGALPTVCV